MPTIDRRCGRSFAKEPSALQPVVRETVAALATLGRRTAQPDPIWEMMRNPLPDGR